MTTAATPTPAVNDTDTSFGNELAAEIRAEIARLGMSRRRLALDIGREPSWLTKRLAGVIPMTTNDVESIATALGTSPVALVLATPSGRRVAQQSITARCRTSTPTPSRGEAQVIALPTAGREVDWPWPPGPPDGHSTAPETRSASGWVEHHASAA